MSTLCFLGVALLLQACATSVFERTIASDQSDIGARAEKANSLLRTYPAQSSTVVNTQAPRFTKHSIPLDRSEMLPNHIASVTLRIPGQHNIKTIAAIIERAIDIPVHVTADAMMPSAMFVPVGMAQVAQTAAAPAANTPGAGPSDKTILDSVQRAGGSRLSFNTDNGMQNDIELNYSGSLAGLLNQVALRADLRWSYDAGRIQFYRMVSRTISINTLPGGLKLASSLSLTSTGGGTSSSSSASDINIWTGIERNLANMVSVSGKISTDPNTGTVTVRDAYRNVEAVEAYLQVLNQTLLRQVSMTVEVLQVNLSKEFQSGIDWNIVAGNLQIKGPTPVTSSTAAASIGFVVKNNSGGSGNQLLIQALEKFGRVSSAYSTVVTTLNRQPVPVGKQTTLSYLKSVAPTVLTSTNGSTAYGPSTLTPGEITTGFTITLLPILLDSNNVLVECGLSLSSLTSLTAFNSGTGANLQTIQQPSIDNFGVMQRLVAKSNETIVLSGFDAELLNNQQVDPLIQKLPGSRSGTKNRSTTLVLITPRLLDL